MQVFFQEKYTIFTKKLSIFVFGLKKLPPNQLLQNVLRTDFFACGSDCGAVQGGETWNGKDPFFDIFLHWQKTVFVASPSALHLIHTLVRGAGGSVVFRGFVVIFDEGSVEYFGVFKAAASGDFFDGVGGTFQ